MGNETPGLDELMDVGNLSMGDVPNEPQVGTSGSEALDARDRAKEEERQKAVVRRWFKRIRVAKEVKKKWEQDYEVNRAHDYVRGFQRAKDDELDAQGDKRYVINKILANLKTKIPSIFYYHPYIRVRPAIGREDSPGQTVSGRALLLQDTINTIIRQDETRLKPECMVALKEAHWAFGIVEGGYSAEWAENPYAKRPQLIESETVQEEKEQTEEIPESDSPEEEIFNQLESLPVHESFYVRHIPARQFYVATNDRSQTIAQDWVGYWEWMYVRDVKRTKSFANTSDLKATAKMREEGYDRDLMPMETAESPSDVPPDMVRVWKIWDQREKKRLVLVEGHDYLLKEEEYEHIPLYDIRLEVMPGEWYPIPPISQQLMEQDEFNDAREWLRLVRKGTRPRYVYDKQAFTSDELEKFETDEFGTFVGVENGNMQPISPVQQPSFGESAIRTLSLSEQGFAEQAATSPIDRLTRGGGGKPTATEVGALSQASDVRQSYEQQEVADWLARIASGLLRTAVQRMTLPQWVLMNSDPHAPQQALLVDTADIAKALDQIQNPVPEDVLRAAMELHSAALMNPKAAMEREYTELAPDDLETAFGDGRWDITVDVESMSPVTEAQHAEKLMQALNMLANPGVGRLLSMSPPLLKNMLNMMGIRNSVDQQSIMQALQMRDQMEQQMAMAQQGGGSQPAEPGVAPMAGGGQPNDGTGAPEGAPPDAPQPAAPPQAAG